MAKTYSVPSIYVEGGTRNNWDSGYWNNMVYTNSRKVETNGYDPSADSYFSLYIMFNEDTLSSLRAKTVTDIKLVVTISGFYPSSSNTYAQIGYKYNNARGSATTSSAYARGNADSTAMEQSCVGYIRSSSSSNSTTSDTQLTIPLTGVVPMYGYAIGPSSYNNQQISFGSSATLLVTTNETDYTYTLSYNANGGSGAPSAQIGNNTAISPSYTFTVANGTPTRTGYTFAGWSDTASGSVAYAPGDSVTLTSTSKTLYAVWTKNSYTVNIKCLDPESAVSTTAAYFDVWYSDDSTHQTNKTELTVTKTYGTIIYINNLRPYYAYTQIDGVNSMVSDGSGQYHYTVDENSTNKDLIIRTARSQYTITYNANGGSNAPSSQTKYGGVTLTLSNAVPTRDGYTFVKWNTASDGSGTDYNSSGSYTANASVTLYAIWVASSSTIILSNQTCEAGQSVDIHINKLTSTAKHTLTYTCGNQNGAIVTKTSLSTVSWTVPLAVVSQISDEGGPCYIYCTTYIDNTQTGVPQEAMLVVTVPSSYQPSVSLAVTKINSNATVNGWGILLQGYSQVQLTATATMASGATLVSYNFTGPGVSYLGSNNQVTSSIINTYGKTPWSVTVTDSRGRTATATWDYDDFEIYQYSNPTIVNAITQRTDSTGVSSSGTFFKTKVNVNIASCGNNNSLTVRKVEYKVSTGSTWTLGDDTLASNVWTSPYGSGTIDQTLAYNVRYTFTDALGNTATLSSNISAIIGIGLGLKNDRLRLGGLPTKPGLQVDWPAEFNGATKINGSLYITPHHCESRLSSAGWYRAVVYNAYDAASAQGSSGDIVDINIVWSATTNAGHHIKLFLDYSNKVAFVGEVSNGTTNLVDKIRYTFAGSKGYIDIHFAGVSSGSIYTHFTFDVATRTYSNAYWVARTLSSVAAAPSGETILAEYDFVADTQGYTKVSIPGTFTAQANTTLASISVPKGRKAIEACILFRPTNSTGKMLIALGDTVCTVPDGDYQAVTLVSPITTETTIYVTCYVYNSTSVTTQGSNNCVLYRFI